MGSESDRLRGRPTAEEEHQTEISFPSIKEAAAAAVFVVVERRQFIKARWIPVTLINASVPWLLCMYSTSHSIYKLNARVPSLAAI